MKLRNKETREIRPAETREDGIYLYDDVTEEWYKFELPLLAKYWEYYEEPEGIIKVEKSIVPTCVHIEYATEEEAERAVGKLKAWERLENKGFKFEKCIANRDGYVKIHAGFPVGYELVRGDVEDLELLFSEEEK